MGPHQTRLPEPFGNFWCTFPEKRHPFKHLKHSAPSSTPIPSSMVGSKLFFQFNKSKPSRHAIFKVLFYATMVWDDTQRVQTFKNNAHITSPYGLSSPLKAQRKSYFFPSAPCWLSGSVVSLPWNNFTLASLWPPFSQTTSRLLPCSLPISPAVCLPRSNSHPVSFAGSPHRKDTRLATQLGWD